MARSDEPVFLERQSYRRRRFADAAKLMPILGFVLFLLPILWSETARSAGGLIYIFAVWAILIALVSFLSRKLSEDEPEEKPNDELER